MIEEKVSNEIDLILVKESFIPDYVSIVKKDFEYLAEWLEWPRFCSSDKDFKKFGSDSIKGHEAGESRICAIRYKGLTAGVAGFNNIDNKLSRVEVGYWISSDFQKKRNCNRCVQASDYVCVQNAER